jgi:hypothetical protein
MTWTGTAARGPGERQNRKLQRLLEEGLGSCLGRRVRIVALEARDRDLQSTHPIERLHVRLASGEELPVIFKRLHATPEAKGERREVLIYRRLLTGGRFGAPLVYASAYDEARAHYWVFLEDVGEGTVGEGDLEDWLAAVRWLGEMHGTYQGREGELRALKCLGEQGYEYYQKLACRARQHLVLAAGGRALARFDSVSAPLDASFAYLARQARTLVHGDVFSDNLILQPGPRIRPIDWEEAAVGIGALDLARLLEGWGSDKPALVAAYLDEFARHTSVPVEVRQFSQTFEYCEAVAALLHLAWSVEDCGDGEWVDGLLSYLETICRRLGKGEGNV